MSTPDLVALAVRRVPGLRSWFDRSQWRDRPGIAIKLTGVPRHIAAGDSLAHSKAVSSIGSKGWSW